LISRRAPLIVLLSLSIVYAIVLAATTRFPFGNIHQCYQQAFPTYPFGITIFAIIYFGLLGAIYALRYLRKGLFL